MVVMMMMRKRSFGAGGCFMLRSLMRKQETAAASDLTHRRPSETDPPQRPGPGSTAQSWSPWILFRRLNPNLHPLDLLPVQQKKILIIQPHHVVLFIKWPWHGFAMDYGSFNELANPLKVIQSPPEVPWKLCGFGQTSGLMAFPRTQSESLDVCIQSSWMLLDPADTTQG